MLEELYVRGVALIEEAHIEFRPGMTALTGETGAGKTAVISALKLLLGERGDATLVRTGVAEAVVEGRFRDKSGEEVIARRRLSADGRSKCHLDGGMASVGMLADRLGPFVDLHGQHAHQSLLRVGSHVGFLDRFAGDAGSVARAAFQEALRGYANAVDDRAAVERSLDETRRASEYLRFLLSEIDAAAPQDGELELIEARLKTLVHADRLAAAAEAACHALSGEHGAGEALVRARVALDRARGLDPALEAHAARLDGLAIELDDLTAELRTYGEAIEHDPAVLAQAQDRRAVLAALTKKYGPTLADVIRARADARVKLDTLDDREHALAVADERVSLARRCLDDAARRLSEVRREHGFELTEALSEGVATLGMAGARFEIAFDELPFNAWSSEGPHRVEFLYSPGPREAARPLAKIASGGELSRVMLALKGVLKGADPVPVLVFDEVDAGIGGAAAHAIGERLSSLAEVRQVIVVTHLAQVASRAHDHLLVTKGTIKGRQVTQVERVEGSRRVAEIARMLAGESGEASLAHAAELLAHPPAASQ